MDQSLAGKVVIITGASSGVGEAAARAFARAGAHVVLAARSVAKLEAVARAVNGLAVPTDVSRFEDLTALIERTVAAHGRLDVLVNNAAANARGTFDTLDPAAIADVQPDPAGLRVTISVSNDGAAAGRTTCRIGDPEIRGIGPETAYVQSPMVEGGSTVEFEAVVVSLGTTPRPLTVDCGS